MIMKILMTTILGLFLVFVCEAQDTTNYAWFKTEFMNIQTITPDYYQERFVDNPTFKPALILLGTFAINHLVINMNNNNHKHTSFITGSVFLIGATMSTIVFFKETKKRKKQNYLENKRLLYY